MERVLTDLLYRLAETLVCSGYLPLSIDSIGYDDTAALHGHIVVQHHVVQ